MRGRNRPKHLAKLDGFVSHSISITSTNRNGAAYEYFHNHKPYSCNYDIGGKYYAEVR